jgi:hypothetical protein
MPPDGGTMERSVVRQPLIGDQHGGSNGPDASLAQVRFGESEMSENEPPGADREC